MAVDCSRARSSDLKGPVTEFSLGAWYVAGDDIRGTQLLRPPTVASWHSSDRYRGVSPRNDLIVHQRMSACTEHAVSPAANVAPSASTLCGTDRAGCSQSPYSRTLACSHTAMRGHSLPFNGLHRQNLCNYIDGLQR